jgi:hypothetical protein
MALPNSSTTPIFVGGGSPQEVGDSTDDLLGFYGTTPIARRAASAQAINVLTTVVATAGGVIFATSTGANALFAQVNEIRATLTALGLWKGSA